MFYVYFGMERIKVKVKFWVIKNYVVIEIGEIIIFYFFEIFLYILINKRDWKNLIYVVE